jgi:hypothetical protein
MDVIVAKRNLAKEKNSAQSAIDEKIRRMAISARETEFILPVMPMSGDIHLSALKPLNIVSIITKEGGSITEVTGIPEGVKNFKFDKHLLVDAPQLPKSLETLNLDGNYIEKIDLSTLTSLKVARLNGNRLKTLGKLPESLEELYIDNNQIPTLNLDRLVKLRILHCRNNHTLRIENIPASMMDFQVEQGNPRILLDYAFLPSSSTSEEDNRMKGTESEFVESMHDYFILKTKYEYAASDARNTIRKNALKRGLGEKKAVKMARELQPKCVNCKRPVGTVFKTREDRLLAFCGDTKEPCALRIEIFKGQFENDDVFADNIYTSLHHTKEQIIRQKMDVLFNYASEEETVTKFKDLIEDYNLYSFLHKTDLDMREEKRFNVHKKELIKAKIETISKIKSSMNVYMEEYAESGNRDSLHSTMKIYINEYMSEINNLRMLKYSVMETIVTDIEKDSPVRVLNQNTVSMRQLETLHGEVPRIIKFNVGKNKEDKTDKNERVFETEIHDSDSENDNGEEKSS